VRYKLRLTVLPCEQGTAIYFYCELHQLYVSLFSSVSWILQPLRNHKRITHIEPLPSLPFAQID
jgi:hypothetical protein